jgi:hypothetical protein
MVYSAQLPSMSNISSDEYSASEWLKSNTLPGDYLLTDPSTGFMLRGLTLRNSSTSFLLDGHPVSDYYSNLSNLTYNFFVSTDPIKCKAIIDEMPLQPKYVVVTTRTSSWVSWGGIQSIYTSPSDSFNSWPGFQKFGSELFPLFKKWGEVSLYRIASFDIRPVLKLNSTQPTSYYLDGDFGNYSQTIEAEGTLSLFAQSRTSSSAWTGIVYKNVSLVNSDYFLIKYKVTNPASSLFLVFRAENLTAISILSLDQKTYWNEFWVPVDNQIVRLTTEIDLLLYTQDIDLHVLSISTLSSYDLVVKG